MPKAKYQLDDFLALVDGDSEKYRKRIIDNVTAVDTAYLTNMKDTQKKLEKKLPRRKRTEGRTSKPYGVSLDITGFQAHCQLNASAKLSALRPSGSIKRTFTLLIQVTTRNSASSKIAAREHIPAPLCSVSCIVHVIQRAHPRA